MNIAYTLDGILRVSTNQESVIIGLGCNEYYKGKYENKLYPGMTMGEVIENNYHYLH